MSTTGRPIEADDGDFIRLRLHYLEQLRRKIGPCGVQRRVAIRRKFDANNAEQLGRQLVPRIEQAVPARFEHALEPAVPRQQGALAILHRHMRHQQMPRHGMPPSLAFRPEVGKQVSLQRKSRTQTRLPESSAGRGLSLRHDGRTRATARQKPRNRVMLPASAQAVSTAAQSRSCSVQVRTKSLAAIRPDRD
jgi:hypothetical protein